MVSRDTSERDWEDNSRKEREGTQRRGEKVNMDAQDGQDEREVKKDEG